jgi:hypothetical protein
MRRWTAMTAAVVGVIMFGLAGCGGDATGPDSSDVDIDLRPREGAGVPPPSCPFTAAQASKLAGQPLHEDGNCLFRGRDAVGIVEVHMASRGAGQTTFDYTRQLAKDRPMRVADLGVGDQSYLAVAELEAEAVVINRLGSYTILLGSLDAGEPGYERILRDMAAALPN